MSEIDPFEQAFIKWYQGIQQEEKHRQAQKNMDTLIKTLREQGHSVRVDLRYIHVDELAIITIDNAREVPVETLVKFVDEVMEREKSKQ